MLSILYFVFFKQKTAYDVRISDWSSDVCSSDLIDACRLQSRQLRRDLLGVRFPVIAQRDLTGDQLEIQLIRQRGKLVALENRILLVAVVQQAEPLEARKVGADRLYVDRFGDRKSTRLNSSH